MGWLRSRRNHSVLLNKRELVVAVLVDMMLGKSVFGADSSSKLRNNDSGISQSVDYNEKLEGILLEG